MKQLNLLDDIGFSWIQIPTISIAPFDLLAYTSKKSFLSLFKSEVMPLSFTRTKLSNVFPFPEGRGKNPYKIVMENCCEEYRKCFDLNDKINGKAKLAIPFSEMISKFNLSASDTNSYRLNFVAKKVKRYFIENDILINEFLYRMKPCLDSEFILARLKTNQFFMVTETVASTNISYTLSRKANTSIGVESRVIDGTTIEAGCRSDNSIDSLIKTSGNGNELFVFGIKTKKIVYDSKKDKYCLGSVNDIRVRGESMGSDKEAAEFEEVLIENIT